MVERVAKIQTEVKPRAIDDAINPVNLFICEKDSADLLYSCLAISTRHNAYYAKYGEKLRSKVLLITNEL